MIEVVSAGGVVYHQGLILMLQKKNGDWVLPKGRIEKGETLEETALREVKEETNVDATILNYIGATNYEFSNYWTQYKQVYKTVSWYIMKADSLDIIPLEKEGFVNGAFHTFKIACELAKYNDERTIIERSLTLIEKYNYN